MGPEEIRALLDRQFPREGAAERIAQARAAVAAGRGDRATRARDLVRLATLLMAECLAGPRKPELDEGIESLRKAIALTPRGRGIRTEAEHLLVIMLGIRRGPGDATAAITTAETLLSQLRSFSPDTGKMVFALANSLVARYIDEGGQDDVDRAIALLERTQARMASSRAFADRALRDMMGFALAICLGARFQYSASADPADIRRVKELVEAVDTELVESLIPGVGQMVETMRSGVPMALQVIGQQAPPGDLLAGGAFTTGAVQPEQPFAKPMRDLENTMQSVSAMVAFGFEGNLQMLDTLVAQRSEIARTQPPGQLRVTALIMVAGALHSRYRTRRLAELPGARRDLDEALSVVEEALADPVFPASGEALTLKGRCLLDRYQENPGTGADLDEAMRLLERAQFTEPADARSALASRIAHSEALMLRSRRDSSLDDLDAAAETLEIFQHRLPSSSPFRAIVAARRALVLQHRSAVLQDTEQLLQASMESRAATEAVAEVSVTWAYDSAWFWANWAWHHAPPPEKAEAHLRAVACLHRLTQAQMTRGAAEVALGRQTRNLVARSMRAAVNAGQPEDAVVAAETGRGVMLSLALQRQESALSTLDDPGLRDRFRQASERLAAIEAALG